MNFVVHFILPVLLVIQYHALLAKRNASFAKNTKSALIAMGFEQFYEFKNMT